MNKTSIKKKIILLILLLVCVLVGIFLYLLTSGQALTLQDENVSIDFVLSGNPEIKISDQTDNEYVSAYVLEEKEPVKLESNSGYIYEVDRLVGFIDTHKTSSPNEMIKEITGNGAFSKDEIISAHYFSSGLIRYESHVDQIIRHSYCNREILAVPDGDQNTYVGEKLIVCFQMGVIYEEGSRTRGFNTYEDALEFINNLKIKEIDFFSDTKYHKYY